MFRLSSIFDNIFNNPTIEVFTTEQFLIVLFGGLVIGLVGALFYCYKNTFSTGFVTTLALMPAVVTIVIITVSDNIGTGIAVAGAFSLVKFRSIPGTAREIGAIFTAMGAGLLNGVGYLGYALLFVIIVGFVRLAYDAVGLGQKKNAETDLNKTLSITVPEDLNFAGEFDIILEKYTREYRLTRAKTINMGTMVKLTYNIILKSPDQDRMKEMLDDIRTRNGNLEVLIYDRTDEESGL